MTIKYIDAIAEGFPNTQFSYIGNVSDNIYENIVWEQGDPIPSKEVLDSWIDVKIRADMRRLIMLERDRRRSGGVQVGGNWFHSDDTSRIQQLGLVMFGTNMPNNIMWKTMTGSFVLMTPQLAAQIFQAVATSDMIVFGTAEAKIAAMMASSDPKNFNYLTGWPPTYGE